MQRSQDMDRVLADLPSIEQPRDSPSRSIRAGNTDSAQEFERARSAGGVPTGVGLSDPLVVMYTYPGDDGYKEAAERHQTGPNPQQPFRQGDEPPQMTPLPFIRRRGEEPSAVPLRVIQESPSRPIRRGHPTDPSLQLTHTVRRGNEPLQLTPLPRRDDEPLQLTPLPRRVRRAERAESYDDAVKRVRGDLGKGKMY